MPAAHLVSCVLSAREAKLADVIVFPEGALLPEMIAAGSSHPQAAVVGAIMDRGHSRGVLLHQERNQINYLKVGSDGRTKGSGDRGQKLVYEMGEVCIGVLICMDVDDPPFARAVIERIRTSPAKVKLLCIPAEAGSQWFPNDVLPEKYKGVHTIFCNNVTYQDRCKSFITDTLGRKILIQARDEPVHAELPG